MNWLKKGFETLYSTELELSQRKELKEKEFLKHVRYNDVAAFNLKGYETWAKCVKTFDGEVMYIVFYLHGEPLKFQVCLANIEIADKKSNDAIEVKWALRACDRLKELIGDNLIYIRCEGWDNGKLMINMYTDDKEAFSINEKLVREGLAYTGKKLTFNEWGLEKAKEKDNNLEELIDYGRIDYTKLRSRPSSHVSTIHRVEDITDDEDSMDLNVVGDEKF
jgi:hypothetical protein